MNSSNKSIIWKFSPTFIAMLLLSMVAIGVMSYTGIVEMVKVWGYREEYSYGYLIPFITLFLLWQKYSIIEQIDFNSAWLGMVIVCIGCLIVFIGNLTTITTIIQYGALTVLIGLLYSSLGKAIKPIIVPLFFLVFMIPLPGFFINNLSAQLQLISSEIGVAVIRLFDISVYLEGNVIDLGSYQLQVVEACSGLNYLFPLMALSFMAVYFFQAPFWQRAVIFLSSIPITVFMNSFRIGVIGVLVEHWGIEQAEGFLHYFEGWVIFIASLSILLIEMWLFVKLSGDKKRLSDVFAIEFPEPPPSDAQIRVRSITRPYIVSVVIISVAAIISVQMEDRQELIPERAEFVKFPDDIEMWMGTRNSLEKNTLNALKLDDYINSDYSSRNGTVNLYVAYYKSQRGGASAHSPRSCIPGGGWQIKEFKTVTIPEVQIAGNPLSTNRLLIKKGDYGQLVYYWFQQRDRIITNEYLVKWYLFWDALTKNRTDGALVRLTTPVNPGEDLKLADQRLIEFAKQVQLLMDQYIPR